MAELWMQVLPIRKTDIDALAQYDQPRVFKAAIDYNQYLIASDPNNARAHNELGKAQLFLGKYSDAHATLSKAAALDPAFDEPHYFLGVLYRMHNRLADAATEFTAAVQRNPDNARAHGSLGIVLMNQGDLDQAESHLRTALRLNPQDQIAKESLEQLNISRRGSGKKN
jgi:Flp pilus assembly protein TadD